MISSEKCPLCFGDAIPFKVYKKKSYFSCSTCKGLFLPSQYHISHEDEKARYDKHNNDVTDVAYQNFVSPIVHAILKNHSNEEKGLDFGAGPGPVISMLLREKNFNIIEYDPYYFDYPERLAEQYDYIVCCEVMEHFNFPNQSFSLLKKLLKPNGVLYCMTDIFSDSIQFDNWYYKNDLTHVFFYRIETLEWIKANFGFKTMLVEGRMIQFFN